MKNYKSLFTGIDKHTSDCILGDRIRDTNPIGSKLCTYGNGFTVKPYHVFQYLSESWMEFDHTINGGFAVKEELINGQPTESLNG